MKAAESIPILNSKLSWTPEYRLTLDDGRVGTGSAPLGETPSIYEARQVADPALVCEALVREGFDRPFTQGTFDAFLETRRSEWGQGTLYALSCAFANARAKGRPPSAVTAYHPALLLNLFNGGLNAYTNPIRSDFPEFLLVPRALSLPEQIDLARGLLSQASAALRPLETVFINGNRVHVPRLDGNDGALALMDTLLKDAGLQDRYHTMVDASGGDLWDGHGYRLPISQGAFSSSEMVDYWAELATRWGIDYLEDPLAEADESGWRALKAKLPGCLLVADNLVSGSLERLRRYGDVIDAVIVKPDQCGTVTATLDLIREAKGLGLEVMISHRSIETDSLSLINLAQQTQADAIKIGPLQGFAAVLKSNALLRALTPEEGRR